MVTDNTSSENMRKFLESNDPAMRRMGLSLAKGSEVPEELYKNIFGLSLWDSEVNREAAGELVEEIGLENITEFPEWLEPFDELGGDDELDVRMAAVKALGKIGDARAVEPLIKALEHADYDNDENKYVRWDAEYALVEIGKPAVEPLITALRNENWWVRQHAARALGEIGDADGRPLNKVLEEDDDADVRKAATEALKKLGHEVE